MKRLKKLCLRVDLFYFLYIKLKEILVRSYERNFSPFDVSGFHCKFIVEFYNLLLLCYELTSVSFYFSSVECYDFKGEHWYAVAEMNSRRCRAGVAVLDGLVYAVGGFNGSLRVRTVDCYDPVKDQWRPVASMEARRSTLGAAVMNGLLYAIGGFDGTTGLNTCEVYDPKLNEWRSICSMSTRRSSVGVGVLNNMLFAVGGYDGASRHCLSSVECYNPNTN